VRVEVRLERESVWLTQQQMARLFGRERSVIARHIGNVFGTGELAPEGTRAFLAQVQEEGRRRVSRAVEHYNLDVILSVGYRVHSRRGTQFRIWATRTLREHLLRGYTLHERRLRERGIEEVEQAVALAARTLRTHDLVTDEGYAVLEVVQRYTRSWRLLLEFDEDRLAPAPGRPIAATGDIDLGAARSAVAALRRELMTRGQASGLFGQEREAGLDAVLGAVDQTFDQRPLYRSAQARAAHLLYLVIKDHPFVDGNKRIGALLFLDALRRSGLLLRPDGRQRLDDGTVVALALLIAESEPRQKDLMVRLTLSLLEDSEP
jgi:prophage maintenance system killer protein